MRAPAIAPHVVILVLAVIASGVSAARVATPLLWIITPAVVATIVIGARRRAPIATLVDLDGAGLPPALRRTIAAAAAELPTGEARTLLGAVITQARAIFVGDRASSFADAAQVRRDVADLAAAACDTAIDLARLDIFLGPRAWGGGEPVPRQADLDARYHAARELFVRRLTDAELALRSLYTTDMEHGTPASDRVAELVTEINAESAARRAAGDELRRLLGSRPAIS